MAHHQFKYTIEVFYQYDFAVDPVKPEKDYVYFDLDTTSPTLDDIQPFVPNLEKVVAFGSLFRGHVYPIQY